MAERKIDPQTNRLLHQVGRMSQTATWSEAELRDSLREGGVDPDRLLQRVRADLASATAPRPLLGVLRQHTQQPPSAIAQALDVPVAFLSVVSRYPKAVPQAWRDELARRAERTLAVAPQAILDALAQPFHYELAASRDTPYSEQTVDSTEAILERSGMSDQDKAYWRALTPDTRA